MAVNMKWHGDDFKRDLGKTIRAKLTTCGEIIISDAQRSMMEPKTGSPGPQTTRSAPGESPAVQTGTLKESLAQEPLEDRVGIRVGTNIRYGLYLELGTRKMRARPWLRPALDRSAKAIRVVFSKI
jgi:HK97 gp10 family phage protein